MQELHKVPHVPSSSIPNWWGKCEQKAARVICTLLIKLSLEKTKLVFLDGPAPSCHPPTWKTSHPCLTLCMLDRLFYWLSVQRLLTVASLHHPSTFLCSHHRRCLLGAGGVDSCNSCCRRFSVQTYYALSIIMWTWQKWFIQCNKNNFNPVIQQEGCRKQWREWHSVQVTIGTRKIFMKGDKAI